VLLDEEELGRLPLLGKVDIRRNSDELLSLSFKKHQLIEARTGGSTGVSLTVYCDQHGVDRRNAAALRSNAWVGWRPAQVAGAIWGNPPVARTIREKLFAWTTERVIYLDTVALTPGSVAAFMNQLRRKRIRILFGHAHSLFIVAQICRDEGIRSPAAMAAIISTSMMLLDNERKLIEGYFNCPVTDRYGCEEVGLIASECDRHNGLHVNDDHLVVEIIGAQGESSGEDGIGEIVVTDLNNFGMPLIRYAVGDMGSWQPGACPCGRSMPRLARVFGRTADFLQGEDGKLVAGVSLVERTLTAIPGLEQIQIVQHAILKATVRCVLSPDADQAFVSRQLTAALQSALGPHLDVAINVVPQLTQDRNGKYRFSVREF